MTTLETPVPAAAVPPTTRARRRYPWLWMVAAGIAAAIIGGLPLREVLALRAPEAGACD